MENASAPDGQLSDSNLSVVPAVFMFLSSAAIFFSLMYCYYSCHNSEKRGTLGSGLLPPQLPVVTYARARGSSAGCVICLGDFKEGEDLKVIPGCGHAFHPQCIDRWLAARRSCPVCRSRILEETRVVREVEGSTDVARDWGVRMERSRSWCDPVNDDWREFGLRRTASC